MCYSLNCTHHSYCLVFFSSFFSCNYFKQISENIPPANRSKWVNLSGTDHLKCDSCNAEEWPLTKSCEHFVFETNKGFYCRLYPIRAADVKLFNKAGPWKRSWAAGLLAQLINAAVVGFFYNITHSGRCNISSNIRGRTQDHSFLFVWLLGFMFCCVRNGFIKFFP